MGKLTEGKMSVAIVTAGEIFEVKRNYASYSYKITRNFPKKNISFD